MNAAAFQFIGSYDNRTMTSTIAAQDAHAMATRTPKPRKPKSRTLDEILDRALAMQVKVEMSSKTFTFYPPKFDANDNFVGHNYGQYSIATKANAWQALDEIALDILKAKSDAQIEIAAAASLKLITA